MFYTQDDTLLLVKPLGLPWQMADCVPEYRPPWDTAECTEDLAALVDLWGCAGVDAPVVAPWREPAPPAEGEVRLWQVKLFWYNVCAGCKL